MDNFEFLTSVKLEIVKIGAILRLGAILKLKPQNGSKRKGKIFGPFWGLNAYHSHVILSLSQQFWDISRILKFFEILDVKTFMIFI